MRKASDKDKKLQRHAREFLQRHNAKGIDLEDFVTFLL